MTDWTHALCAGDPDAWHMPPQVRRGNRDTYTPDGMRQIAVAVATCQRCPILDACATFAADADPYDGLIWAGKTPEQRRTGRPPARHSINHGTEGGNATHRRRGETPCAACHGAAIRAQRERRLRSTS